MGFDLSGYDHKRRVDGRRHWPERLLDVPPEERAAAVARAVMAAEARHRRRPKLPQPKQLPAVNPAMETMSNAEAARLVGISPAAMIKRRRRWGSLAAAIAMGARHDRARVNIPKTKSALLSAAPIESKELTPQ